MRGYNSSTFLSNNLRVAMSDGVSEDVDENDMPDADDPEVDMGNASGNRQTNKEPATEGDNVKNSLRWIRQGIFARRPISNTSFLKRIYSRVPIHAR